jgi:hypothetical protein
MVQALADPLLSRIQIGKGGSVHAEEVSRPELRWFVPRLSITPTKSRRCPGYRPTLAITRAMVKRGLDGKPLGPRNAIRSLPSDLSAEEA